MSFYERHGKRWLDLGLTLPGGFVLLPVVALIALLVRLFIGSPRAL